MEKVLPPLDALLSCGAPTRTTQPDFDKARLANLDRGQMLEAKESQQDPPKGASWRWALLLLLLFSLRLFFLVGDPLLISPSGMYLSDEGWYSKAASQLFDGGQLDQDSDFVPITHTPGYTALQLLLFRLALPRLWLLRGLSLLALSLGGLALYRRIARELDRERALLFALAMLSNLLLCSLSVLAIPDSVAFGGTLLCLALLADPRAPSPRDWLFVGACGTLGSIKFSYLPLALWAALLIALRSPQGPRRPSLTREQLGRGLLIVCPLALGAAVYLGARETWPQAWQAFTELNLQGRRVQNLLLVPLNAIAALGADLWSTGALGLAYFVARLCFKAKESPLRHPWAKAIFVLAFLNLGMRAFISYHPPRYGLLTYLLVLLLSLVVLPSATQRWGKAAARKFWLYALLLGQLPNLAMLGWHGLSTDSLSPAVSSIRQEIEQRSSPSNNSIILYGSGSASLIALDAPRIRSVDISPDPARMCERFAHYGPGFLLLHDRKAEESQAAKHLRGCSPQLSLREIGRYKVLNNYYSQGPLRLYQISREP